MFVLHCTTNSDSISTTLNFQVTREFFSNSQWRADLRKDPRSECPVQAAHFYSWSHWIDCKAPTPPWVQQPVANRRTDLIVQDWLLLLLLLFTISCYFCHCNYYYNYYNIYYYCSFFMKYNHFLFNDLRKCKNLERFLKQLAPNP